MPESNAVISNDPPLHFRDITMALARTVDGLLGRLEDTQQDATLYIEIRNGKLWRGDIKMPVDFSEAQ